MNEVNWMQQGWECPKCGAVMSPTTSCCVNCRGNKGGGIATTIIVGDQLNIEEQDGTKFPSSICSTDSEYPQACYKVKSHIESAPDSFKYWKE